MSAFNELVGVASDLGILSRSVAQGEAVLPDRVSLVLSGAVASLTPRGGLLAAVSRAGDIVGAETLAGLAAPLNCVWLTPGLVLEASGARLSETTSPQTLLRWLGEASNLAQIAMGREVACRVAHAIPSRLANLLLIMSQQGRLTTLQTLQFEIARLLGVQRTSISAGMAELKDRGVARVIRGRTEIDDVARLRLIACGCGASRSFDGQEAYSPVGLTWGGPGWDVQDSPHPAAAHHGGRRAYRGPAAAEARQDPRAGSSQR